METKKSLTPFANFDYAECDVEFYSMRPERVSPVTGPGGSRCRQHPRRLCRCVMTAKDLVRPEELHQYAR